MNFTLHSIAEAHAGGNVTKRKVKTWYERKQNADDASVTEDPNPRDL
jgi:hypothetical protein